MKAKPQRESWLPSIVAVGAIALTITLLVAINSEPRLIPGKIAVPVMLSAAALSLASVYWSAGRTERKSVGAAKQDAALRKLLGNLSLRQPATQERLGEFAKVELQSTNPSSSQTVEMFVRDTANHGPRVTLIAGPAGSGKSTILADIATQVAQSTMQGTGSSLPLWASASTWEIGGHFNQWIENSMSANFAIEPKVTSGWIHGPAKILFIDDLDNRPVNLQRDLIEQALRWHRSPTGGRIVAGSEITPWQSFDGLLNKEVDQVAVLAAMGSFPMGQLVRDLLDRSVVFGQTMQSEFGERQRGLLVRMLEKYGTEPSVLDGIEWGIQRMPEVEAWNVGSQDRTSALMLAEGDEIARTEKWDLALAQYRRLKSNRSPIGAVASMRIALIQAGLGQHAATRNYSDALRLFQDLNPRLLRSREIDSLTASEQQVVNVLSNKRPLLSAQILAATRLPVGTVNFVLKSLHSRGLLLAWESGSSKRVVYELSNAAKRTRPGWTKSPKLRG